MKGLIIWAQSSCRSTMGLYGEIAKQIGVPVVIALWFYHTKSGQLDNRSGIGLDPDEFAHIPTIPIGEDLAKGLKLLDDYAGYDNYFAVYQNSQVWRHLIVEAKKRGARVFVGSESPCNMSRGIRYLLKEFYLRYALKCRICDVVSVAEKFINYSGGDDKYALLAGWPKQNIVPFGYFPPPLEGSHFMARKSNTPFLILATGELSRYRGSDIFVDALVILKKRGLDYKAIITQDGELMDELKAKVNKYNLSVELKGFIPMQELISLYEKCTVYVAAGRHEPWGMRLNDALNCGAPLVVSRGMGGVKMVDDYGCGLSFKSKDAIDLADKLYLLATDFCVYKNIAENVRRAVENCSPCTMAKKLIDVLRG